MHTGSINELNWRVTSRYFKQFDAKPTNLLNSKKSVELNIANKIKSNPKEFYGYVRRKKVITSNIGPLPLDNGEHVNNEVDMAETLNEYFASIFTSEDK